MLLYGVDAPAKKCCVTVPGPLTRGMFVREQNATHSVSERTASCQSVSATTKLLSSNGTANTETKQFITELRLITVVPFITTHSH